MAHKNNVGFVRLTLACMVIVSHSYEIIDGNRSREPLVRLFGGLSLGDLAVYGFFLISGYLVFRSYQRSITTTLYIRKRVARIYPGYVVAYIVSVFLVGPFAGVHLLAVSRHEALRILFNGLMLQGPFLVAFPGLPFKSLNGSMWTIAYEFRCYLAVLVLGPVGTYWHKWLPVLMALFLLAIDLLQWAPTISLQAEAFLGDPRESIKLTAVFLVGVCFAMYEGEITFNGFRAIIALTSFVCCLHFPRLSLLGTCLFGGYLLFWFSLRFRSEIISRINNRDDVSYGVYLYAWPIQSLLVSRLHIASPLLLSATTVPVAIACGVLSWLYVERRFLQADRGKSRGAAITPVPGTRLSG